MSLLAVVFVHVPALPLAMQAMGHAFANAIGQEHRWNMFSADPRGSSVDLWASLTTETGESTEWAIDRSRPGGDLAHYHWMKWVETAVLDPERANIEGLANWLMDQAQPAAREVTIYGEVLVGVHPSERRPDPKLLLLLHMRRPAHQ
jgi:hypothetical protein